MPDFLRGMRMSFGFCAGAGSELIPDEAEQATIARAKRQHGSAEPAAFAEATDTTYTTGGRVGFASMANRDYRLDWFSVALNGGTAPGPNG